VDINVEIQHAFANDQILHFLRRSTITLSRCSRSAISASISAIIGDRYVTSYTFVSGLYFTFSTDGNERHRAWFAREQVGVDAPKIAKHMLAGI
jgi:hypothetical protein